MKTTKPLSKVVVFDLDETLGFFLQFGMIWDVLHQYRGTRPSTAPNTEENNLQNNTHSQQQLFNSLLDLYPEYIRPHMFTILKYLKQKKQKQECNGVMIYTNNPGRQWVHLIKTYFQTKLKYDLFDQIICAFKVNGKKLEICRTTYDKTMHDFIRCTKLPENTEICFLDDLYHPEMIGENVYYIKINPYIHNLSIEEILGRFLKSDVARELEVKEDFKEFFEEYMKHNSVVSLPKTTEEYEIDKIVSKKTMILLQDFFSKGSGPEIEKNEKRERKKLTRHHHPKNVFTTTKKKRNYL
jgi:hypothetical protein